MMFYSSDQVPFFSFQNSSHPRNTTTLSLLLVVIILVLTGCSKKPQERIDETETIYANTSKEVRYVGSRKCASCHGEIYKGFMKSEMGRSMAKLDTMNIIEEYPQREPVYDSAKNFYYTMVRKGNQFFQYEYRLDNAGKVVHERWVQADYAIGSGNNLRMYFHDENGMLYEMPLTWYVQRRQWDFSPGYREFGNLRFTRYAKPRCIQCHNAYLEQSTTALDRYVKPYPLGIGCERCHGPGELHLRQKMGESIPALTPGAKTIVNPGKLPPEQQLDVCRQCHLQGKAWALNGDIGWFDFYPGKRLESHRSVYFPAVTQKEVFEVADSPHRLSLSRCFKESKGALNCITCHDPHQSIHTFSVDDYNKKCLQCHPSESLPVKESGHKHLPAEDCVSCHMNRTGTDNTLHGVSNTDHWIRVGANETRIDWSTLRRSAVTQQHVALVAEVDASDDAQDLRRGVALLEYYNEIDNRTENLDSAIYFISKGLERIPTDSRGYLLYGQALKAKNWLDQAIDAFRQALSLQPGLAEAYGELGHTYYALHRFDSSEVYFRKAVAFKHDEPGFLQGLGLSLVQKGEYAEAALVLEHALQIDSQNPFVFFNLASLYALHLRQPEKALHHQKVVVMLDPDFPKAYLNLGNIYAMQGKYEEAIHSYEEEIAHQSSSVDAYLNLGKIYNLTGKKSQSRKAFEKALVIDPSSEIAKVSLSKLR